MAGKLFEEVPYKQVQLPRREVPAIELVQNRLGFVADLLPERIGLRHFGFGAKAA